jgi:HAD superfamily hydrolase (TIGR01490 family)
MSSEGRKFAVFDIDGTLFRWQLFHELVFELSHEGCFPEDVSLKLTQAFAQWRGQSTTWDEYEQQVISAISDNITNIPTKQLEVAAKIVLNKSGNNVHAYTANLAKNLKAKGYYLLALSGSQQEIAEIFAKKHGFDQCIGMVHGRTDAETYSGVIERFVVDKKGTLLKSFVSTNNLSFKDSYGIGDSSSDIPVLELVEHPIAFNPNELLLETAKQNGWDIVIERKNIAYTLSKKGEIYGLAKATAF